MRRLLAATVGAASLLLVSLAVPAHASSVVVDCSNFVPTSQSASVSVGEALAIDYGSGGLNACPGYNVVDSGPGAFSLDGVPVSTNGPLSNQVLTYVSQSSGFASIELGSVTLTITIQGAVTPERAPGVGEPLPEDVPNQAGSVQATAGVYSATVSWSMPSQPGEAPVTLYEASASPGGKTCTADAPSTSCRITGLLSGTTYTFTVKSFNTIGWGPASAPSNAVVPSGVAPNAPQGVFTVVTNASLVQAVWSAPDNPLQVPLTIQAEAAYCAVGCTSLEGLVFSPIEADQELEMANLWRAANGLVPILRVRSVEPGGLASAWVYTTPRPGNELSRVSKVNAYSDRSGSLVTWEDEVNSPASVGGYRVEAWTKESAGEIADFAGEVGRTTKMSLRLPVVGDVDKAFVWFSVVPEPSFLYSLSQPGTMPVPGTGSSWRRQVDAVPTPKIIKASFGARSKVVSVEWEPGVGVGAVNVVGFLVEYRDAKTGKWSDASIAGPENTGITLIDNRDQAVAVSGIRVAAVAWPGKHTSGWAMAVS